MQSNERNPDRPSGNDTDAQSPREGYKVVLRGNSGFIFSERHLARKYASERSARTGTEPSIEPATITDPKRRFADGLVEADR